MFIYVLTQHQYISFVGYMFRFLYNHLQANVNYREVLSPRDRTPKGEN